MYYSFLFIFLLTNLLIIFFLIKSKNNNNKSNLIVPYTIKDANVDFIHYGYFTMKPYSNNFDSSDNIFYIMQLNLIHVLLENININKNDYILDVGCGVGGFIKFLNTNYSNINILGIDINDIHINICKNKNKLLNNNNTIEYYNSDITTFHSKYKINKIFAIESGFHYNKFMFLKNAFNYMADDGSIIIADIVTTSKINNYINQKSYIDNIIHESFSVFDSFWEPFDYVLTMQQIGYKNIQYLDITNETIDSYFYLEKYSYKDTLKGILLLKELHQTQCLKYIIIKATK